MAKVYQKKIQPMKKAKTLKRKDSKGLEMKKVQPMKKAKTKKVEY